MTLYWRPACGFCASLRRQLAQHDLDLVEVDIWQDPAGAAVVRRFAGGNETVPTVVIGDPDGDDAIGLVNPSGREVLEALAHHDGRG